MNQQWKTSWQTPALSSVPNLRNCWSSKRERVPLPKVYLIVIFLAPFLCILCGSLSVRDAAGNAMNNFKQCACVTNAQMSWILMSWVRASPKWIHKTGPPEYIYYIRGPSVGRFAMRCERIPMRARRGKGRWCEVWLMKKGKGQYVGAEPLHGDGKIQTRFSGQTQAHLDVQTCTPGLHTFRQHAAFIYKHTHTSVKQLGRLSVPALLINL